MSQLRNFIEWFVAITVLFILVAYTYIHLFATPFLGFYFHPATGQIVRVFDSSETAAQLQVGDQIRQIGDLSWANFRANQRQPFLEGYQPGQTVPLLIARDGDEQELAWHLPVNNRGERIDRLLNIWWLSYVLWIAGALTIILIRPIDIRRYLLIAFYFLTALWIMFGAISTQHTAQSAILLRIFIWLSVPVYLHLHWEFPRSLKPLPIYWWILLYLVGGALAAAEWWQILPLSAYYIGALIALLGSIILLGLHLRQPGNKREIGILVLTILIAFLPIVVVSVISVVIRPPDSGSFTLLALFGIPIAYLYSSYRRQTGWLELRANRIIALFFFLMLVESVVVAILTATTVFGRTDLLITVGTFVSFLAVLATVYLFPRFRRYIERSVLGMPLPPADLLADYTTGIATSPDRESLVRLLKQRVTSTLLIRQSVLLELREQGYNVVYSQGVDAAELPTADMVSELLFHIEQQSFIRPKSEGWVHLVIPIRLEDKVIGLGSTIDSVPKRR